VAVQAGDESSLLNQVRRIIALRQAHPALCASSSFEPVYADADKLPFVYMRQAENEKLLVALNPANQPCDVMLDGALFERLPETLYGEQDAFTRVGTQWRLHLHGIQGGVFRLQK
jgi:glycosidase